jgi:hypothetical protein
VGVSSDYGHIAGEIADRGGDDYDPYLDDPDHYREPDPPEDWLEAEAERGAQRHRERDHGGGECDCPVAEPEYSEEAPFLWTQGWAARC